MGIIVLVVVWLACAYTIGQNELTTAIAFAAVTAYDLRGRLTYTAEMEALLSPEAGISIRSIPAWLLTTAAALIFCGMYFRWF